MEISLIGYLIIPVSLYLFFSNPGKLYVLTILMENEHGEVKPVTTSDNKEWIKSERMRLRDLH